MAGQFSFNGSGPDFIIIIEKTDASTASIRNITLLCNVYCVTQLYRELRTQVSDTSKSAS